MEKRNAHPTVAGDDVDLTKWERAGIRLTSQFVSEQQPPSRADAMSRLQAWGADLALSGEPFPLTLRDGTKGSTGALCRGTCAANGCCRQGRDCKFVAHGNYAAATKQFFIAKKNGHVEV